MDNLELFHSYKFRFTDDKYKSITACSQVDGTIVCCVCGSNMIYVHNIFQDTSSNFQITELKLNLKYIQHLPIYGSIFVASETELAVIDIGKGTINVIQTLENGILDLVWDPIQSVFAFIDLADELHIYSYTHLTVEGSFSLNRNVSTKLSSKVPGSVMVGWGSQFTQFQGAKHQRQKVEEVQKVEENIFDGGPKISWRGNGEQFVINFFKEGCRYVKVFDNQLNPLFESDGYHDLIESISFMGQGQYIASCMVKNNSNNLVIFEKNCKIKATTKLDNTKGFILKILFHPQMNILGILSRDKEQNSFIDIYLYVNACWYLKQQLYYPLSKNVHDFFWVESNVALLTTCKMIIVTNEEVQYHTFRFVINKSPVEAITGVINGHLLDIHLFENTIIPPPMCSLVFEHVRPINRILFHPERNVCMLIDSQCQLNIIGIKNNLPIKLLSSTNLNFGMDMRFLEVDWKVNNEIHVYFECENQIGIIEEQKEENLILTIIGTNTQLSNSSDLQSYKVLDNSQIVLYHTNYILKMSNMCMPFDITLNSCRELCINNKIVCSGVTTSILFKTYLIWTTSSGMLYCIRDRQFGEALDLSKIFIRPIEQGSRIVCCNNMTPPQIIMQLPRGNLETISCKLITIDIIDDMLSENRWKDVLHIIRLEKINWNVLIDLNPVRFCENIESFVKASKFCNILSAIVTEFDLDGNCFQTIYKHYREEPSVGNSVKKKDIVEKIIDFLCSKNCVNNLSCIVAIQQKHISLKSALISLKQVYKSDMPQYEGVCSKMIRQMLQQAHLSDLLNAAFTLFDLPLLALIYRNSNEDPKVYAPELTNLHNMNNMERRFQMCLKAFNLVGAVKYLLMCDTFEDEYVTSFVIKNKLEHVAYCHVNNYNTVSRHLKLISTVFAKRLTIEGKYIESGFVLKRAGLLEESLQQYQKALEWREVISLMKVLNYTENQTKLILESLAGELLTKNKVEDALTLFEFHLKDYKKVVESLVKCNDFHRALSIARTYDDGDSLYKIVIPSLLSYTDVLKEKVNTLQTKFQQYVNRLQIVREETQKKLERQLDEGNLYQSGDDELFSETSSISTGRSSKNTSSSRRSTLSSRNRRKAERKKIDLREGGIYEDIALMRVLHIMYDEVYEVTKEVRNVCLIEELNKDEFCRDIHKQLNKLQIQMREKIKDIWPDEFYKTSLTKDVAIQAVIQNKNDLDPKYAIPPSEELLGVNWMLNMFS